MNSIDFNIKLHKALSNPNHLDVKEVNTQPKLYDKVSITNFSLFTGSEVSIIYKVYNNTFTVINVIPRIEGTDGNYTWVYDIEVEEIEDQILFPHYKFIPNE